jgi:hypothetical protein
MIISQDPQEIQAALALMKKCELRRVSLHECRVTAGEPESSGKPPFSLSLSHDATASSVLDGTLRIMVCFRVASHDKSDPANLLFEVQCSFELLYDLTDKSFIPEASSIAAFTNGNAIFNCWPYAREFVQSMTSRMALSPPPLPLLKIAPKPAAEVPPTLANPEKKAGRRLAKRRNASAIVAEPKRPEDPSQK